MAYTPPTGDSIVFTFAEAYTPPAGNALALEFVETVSGEQYCSPDGWDSSEFGAANIQFGGNILFPTGFVATEFGTLRTIRFIKPNGFSVMAFGLPHDVDYEIRHRYMTGVSSMIFGTAKIGTTKYLQPQGDTQTQFGVTQIGYHRTIVASGWDSSIVGLHAIDYVRLLPLGFEQAEYGTGSIRLDTQILRPSGQTHTGLDVGTGIFLRSRYVLPPSIGPAEGIGPSTVYGIATLTGPSGPIQPYGWSPLRFGAALIENAQWPFIPSGIFNGAVGTPDIAHRHRVVVPVGFSEEMTSAHTIANKARALQPASFDRSVFGTHAIRDRAQYATVEATLPFTGYGTAFIADRVRTVTVFFAPGPPLIDPPEIELKTNYLAPSGIDSLIIQQGEIRIHRTVIAPWSILPWVQTSAPTIRNRNYEITPATITHTEFGRPSLHKTTLEVAGLTQLAFGNALIRDRKQTLRPVGWISLGIPPHSIRPDPYVIVQRIRPVGWLSPSTPSSPSLSTNVLRMFGVASASFGLDTTIRNIDRVLKPSGWIDTDFYDFFGHTALTFTQFIRPNGIAPLATQVPEPRLSPYTIHAPRPGAPVDAGMVKEGRPAIQHRNRVVNQDLPLLGSSYGTARITLRNRRLFVGGFNSFKYGIPKMGGGISTYPASSAGETSAIPDTHKISRVIPYSPYLLPEGLKSDVYGDLTRIDLKNRALIFETDFDEHTRYGLQGVFRTPRFVQANGSEMTIWGPKTFVADRIRRIYPKGFDSFNAKASYPVHSTGGRNPPGITPVHALR